MFTVITCSINPDSASALRANVETTIGVPFEFMAFDNREARRGICSIYNECARNARYDLLCFVHEDVEFRTQNWGEVIARKLHEPDCGVIGFAGSISKLTPMTGFGSLREHTRFNYYQGTPDGKVERKSINPDGLDFSPVICLDGMCLIVRRDVWERSPFDEKLFTGFHAYDIDFTIAVACNYHNYVCNLAEVFHASIGNFGREWYENAKICHEKWRSRLPMFASGGGFSPRQIERMNREAEMRMLKFLFKRHVLSRRELWRLTEDYIRRDMFDRLSYVLFIKYLRYGLWARS